MRTTKMDDFIQGFLKKGLKVGKSEGRKVKLKVKRAEGREV